ncbi:MAG: cytochrome B [Rhodobacteraceae bacterium]|nr:MAG: cytochrome B [Paracoccaceae bacterium]
MTAGTGPHAERVWDPFVRVAHWSIAVAVVLNGLIIEEESVAHIWIGYAALGLLALRMLWGFVGPETARFESFPPSLSAARAHLGEVRTGVARPHRSHNPLGALNAYAMWAALAVVCVTGLALEETSENGHAAARSVLAASALADDDDRRGGSDEGESLVEELHEGAANALLLLALLHVAGVAFETRRSGVDLVGAMVHGEKRFPSGPA